MEITKKPDQIYQQDKIIIDDGSDHLITYKFSFTSSDNNQRYIIVAEYHKEDVFGIKFYAKNHQQSKSKYHLVTNYKYPIRVFVTCASVLPKLIVEHPNASFGFIGARTIKKKKIIEDIKETIRFRIYTEHIPQLVGEDEFEHFEYPKISSYLVVNKKSGNIKAKKKAIEKMFYSNYSNIHSPQLII